MEGLPKYSAVTGRGGTAIYLLLRHTAPDGVLLAPANLCYAALYPALYAGWQVRFCDVDPFTGGLTPNLLGPALKEHRPAAVLLPHMYGQPLAGLPQLVRLCHEAGALAIEDCASALGAEADYPVGRVGDYALYSTGYAKIIEVGFGGLLASETDPLDWVQPAEQSLPLYSEEVQRTEALFSQLYRVLRNAGEGALEQAVYQSLPQGARRMFLYRLGPEQGQRVRAALKALPAEVARRRACLKQCEQALLATGQAGPDGPLRLYPYTKGAVPWRFCLFAPPCLHRPLIDACLREGLPVSDWYPRVTPLFGDGGEYPGARAMEESILNFPLRQQTAETICPALGRLTAGLARDRE